MILRSIFCLLLVVFSVSFAVGQSSPKNEEAVPFGIKPINPFGGKKIEEKEKPIERVNTFHELLNKKAEAPAKKAAAPTESARSLLLKELERETEGINPFIVAESEKKIKSKSSIHKIQRISQEEMARYSGSNALFSTYDSPLAQGLAALLKK